jgi:lipopolysaccharide export system protein LptA
MNRSMHRWAALVALALVAWAPLSRAEVELTAANKSVNPATNVTSYTGNVVLKVPAGTPLQLSGVKGMRRERGLEIVRGEIEFKADALVVRTQQASIERNDKFTVVKMEAAEASKASP